VAKAIDQRLTEQTMFTLIGQVVGTLDYMSPEQADPAGVELDTRSDIYSLGVVLFEAVTGRRPFVADSAAELLEMHRTVPPPDPAALAPGPVGALAAVVLRCLEKEPGERYATAGDLRRALEPIGGGSRGV
jgi:serine/threonine-protein kinase